MANSAAPTKTSSAITRRWSLIVLDDRAGVGTGLRPTVLPVEYGSLPRRSRVVKPVPVEVTVREPVVTLRPATSPLRRLALLRRRRVTVPA